MMSDFLGSTDWWLDTKNLLFPQFCTLCDARLLTEENGYFCPDCWERSPRIERPYCNGCGKPHAQMAGYGARDNFPCADCREKPNRFIRRSYGAMRYCDAVEAGIKLLKFDGKERLAGAFGELMQDFAAEEMPCDGYDRLVPVPLHPVRQRERGFNQSLLLAEAALPAFSGAEIDQSLHRIRPTRVQSRLSAAERRANVRGAFAVLGDELKGARVLLIDDVVTTTGTVTECARALRRGGAASVDVFAAAMASDAARTPSYIE